MITAVVMINCETGAVHQVAEELTNLEGVAEVYSISGDYDIMAVIRVKEYDSLAKLVAMREELRQLWTRTNVSAEQLVADLQAWCRKAEDSGIAALREFSLKLRAAHA